jgi:hypothetical protein
VGHAADVELGHPTSPASRCGKPQSVGESMALMGCSYVKHGTGGGVLIWIRSGCLARPGRLGAGARRAPGGGGGRAAGTAAGAGLTTLGSRGQPPVREQRVRQLPRRSA